MKLTVLSTRHWVRNFWYFFFFFLHVTMRDRRDESHVLGEETEAASLYSFLIFLPEFSDAPIPFPWLLKFSFLPFFEVDTVAFCWRRSHRCILFPNLVFVDSYTPPWLSFRVVTTRVSHLRVLMEIYLNSMPFKLFFKKQFSTVDLETNRSILASIISD